MIVFGTNPIFGLQFEKQDFLGFTQCVVYNRDASGTFQRVDGFLIDGSDYNSQLLNVLVYSGVTPPANIADYLAHNTKDQVIQAILKWVREKLLPLILGHVNSKLIPTTPPVTGGNFTDVTDVMNGVLAAIKFSYNASTNKYEGTI